MNITIVLPGALLPTKTYGGTERVMWYLAHELQKKGHKVYILCEKGSQCDFATCLPFDGTRHINEQIPEDTDIIHFNNWHENYSGGKPFVVTYHGNINEGMHRNGIFVSRNHAQRNNSDSFVYNGLDWDDYGELNTTEPRTYFHFLGKAAWRVKNVKGAIDVVKSLPNGKLYVLGGTRLNLKMGFRLTLTPKARFAGMVGGKEKIDYLQHSKGLIFPVRWHEPFGLAITESMYCGAPVFGTPYGSLPELVTEDTGFLTDSKQEMVEFIRDRYTFSPKRCHDYALELFNSRIMAERYLEKYETVLAGGYLNAKAPTPSADSMKARSEFPFS